MTGKIASNVHGDIMERRAINAHDMETLYDFNAHDVVALRKRHDVKTLN